MKPTFTLLIFVLLFLQAGYAQCRYGGIPGKLRRYCVSDSKPTPELMTSLSVLFDKYSFLGQVSFAKAADKYYFYLHLTRDMSNRFELHQSNVLILNLESGKKLELYPNGDYSGKKMLSVFAIGCYYSLSKEQLQTLAAEKITTLTVYTFPGGEAEMETTSDDGGNGWKKDSKGHILFRHTIDREEPKEKCRTAAGCILQKG